MSPGLGVQGKTHLAHLCPSEMTEKVSLPLRTRLHLGVELRMSLPSSSHQ